MKEIISIVNRGAGGFLNPPGHPEHNYSFSDLKTSMSLSRGIESDWLDDSCKEDARNLLDKWETEKLPLDSAPIQDWIHSVLGYFAGCYKGQDKEGNPSWKVSFLRINSEIDGVLNADLHAGVNLIRKYYPSFKPTKSHFKNAYWGQRIA